MGCSIMASGTHPTSSWQDQALTEKASYEQLGDEYGRLAHEQLVFGCHVHVGVEDRDLRIAAIDRVRPRLAPLLALTANSPYWEGTDTAFASYRYVVFSRWPTFVTPDPLTDWATYQQLVDELLTSGAIDSPKRLYWTVRPSDAFPTIEFRIADVCRTVSEAVMVAGLTRALVATALRDAASGTETPEVRPEVLRMAEWQAARHGLDGDLIDPFSGVSRPAAEAVATLLDHLGPALDEGDSGGEVRETVAEVLRTGNGATRQRRIHDERGMDAVLALLELRSAGRRIDEPAEEAPVRRTVD
jgi:carboxylate-amine ligase